MRFSKLSGVVLTAAVLSTQSGADSADAQPKVVVDGLDGPTQFVVAPDGKSMIIAQLNGDEKAATGQIIRVDLPSKRKTVLWDRLDKPTGVAIVNNNVWIMQKRSLWTAPYDPKANKQKTLTSVLTNLPYNGRSEGTLTPTPKGQLLYETSGNIESSGKVTKDSGALWSFDPKSKRTTVVARGLKNSYGHVLLSDGRAMVTEIGDNIDNAPVDELNIVSLDPRVASTQNAGWPACPGEKTCSNVITPVVTFAPHTTPTGVIVDTTYAYVALFVSGEIHRVPLKPKSAKVTSEVVVNALQGPHTLVLRPNGTLWVSEHLTGRIISVTP